VQKNKFVLILLIYTASQESLPSCPSQQCEVPISVGDLRKAIQTFGAEIEKPPPEIAENIEIIRQSVGVFAPKLTNSLELFLASVENMARCPNCSMVFEKVPLSQSDPRYKEQVNDEKGNPITGLELAHYLEQRFRCFNCTTIFCAQCNTVPYHLGKTCRQVIKTKNFTTYVFFFNTEFISHFLQYLEALQKKKCRYCQEELPDSTTVYVSL
jgi:hypothetical protein